MKIATFISFTDGFFKFTFENGEDMYFEEIHPKVLHQFDLENDEDYIDQEFKVIYSESMLDDETMYYRIENLKIV
ncbi:MAG: hypothetical protein KUG68_09300 [Flavobacteriaceae bacterium]|nr:hypothetical protein [Flavobacteriaceae bacterium]